MRGRRDGSVSLEIVHPDLLRTVAAFYWEPDNAQIWKVRLGPKAGLDEQTISEIPKYSLIMVERDQVKELWPEQDEQIDSLTDEIVGRGAMRSTA
jgi:hypothetical protein